MPNNNINLSIDYLKIQGARKVTKDGKDYVLIDIAASRAKHFKREGKDDSVYGQFDIKSNRDGEDKFGNTHFCAEGTTKEERAAKTRLPIIGNAKEFVFAGQSQQRPAPRQQQSNTQTDVEPPETDDIPF